MSYDYDHVLDPGQRRELLRLARGALGRLFAPAPASIAPPSAAGLTAPAAAFVSLHAGPVLRGCVGTLEERSPLCRAVAEMAVAAATRDPRFTPLVESELPGVSIEISVLSHRSAVTAAEAPALLRVGDHGVNVIGYGRHGVLLPQVAIEQGWSAVELLRRTCRKAGLPAEAWRDRAVRVELFCAQVFGEAGEGLEAAPRRVQG